MVEISFFVPGVPAPGGSKKAFRNKHTGKINIVDDAKNNKPWRERALWVAREHYKGPLLDEPLQVYFEFHFVRPKCHYRLGKHSDQLKAHAPRFPAIKPDPTKLVRAIEDALTGVLWRDDSLIVHQIAAKLYRTAPGCLVRVWTMEGT